jgi:hypothetical protein
MNEECRRQAATSDQTKLTQVVRRGLILLSSGHFGLDLLDLFHDTHDEISLSGRFDRRLSFDGSFALLACVIFGLFCVVTRNPPSRQILEMRARLIIFLYRVVVVFRPSNDVVMIVGQSLIALILRSR